MGDAPARISARWRAGSACARIHSGGDPCFAAVCHAGEGTSIRWTAWDRRVSWRGSSAWCARL